MGTAALTASIHSIQKVLAAPSGEREDRMRNLFSKGLPVLVARYSDGQRFELPTLCIEELRALAPSLKAPKSFRKLPLTPVKAEVSVENWDLDRLLEVPDPRNGNAQLGDDSEAFGDLLNRFRHLARRNLDNVQDWIWIGQRPLPIQNDQLQYLAQRYDSFLSNHDRWFELPIRSPDADREVSPPARLAVTRADGLMQAFDCQLGFIGPRDFIWLKALQSAPGARIHFEGLRAKDATEDGVIPGARAYGVGPSMDLEEVSSPEVWLVPNSSISMKNGEGVLSLASRSTDTSYGPWLPCKDGLPYPELELCEVEAPFWGYVGRKRQGDNPPTWITFPKGTAAPAGPEFTSPPKLGPGLESLIGEARLIDGTLAWGAISSETGKCLVPFTYQGHFEYGYNPDCLIFLDEQGRHTIFTPDGERVAGPLEDLAPPDFQKDFEIYALNFDDPEERSHVYRTMDLPRIYNAWLARRRFGDLSPSGPNLSPYAGLFLNGRKDADLAGLWGCEIEIAAPGKVFGRTLKKGDKGRIGFGAMAGVGGSSSFNWLEELPIEGLVRENPGRVIAVPFKMLKALPCKTRGPFAKLIGRRSS